MDYSLELSNLIEVKAVLKEWKKQNPDLYQYAVCKKTKRAITQIFGGSLMEPTRGLLKVV